MTRSRAVLAIVLGSAVAACQRAPEPAASPSPNAPVSQSVAPGQEPGAGQGLESTPAPGGSEARSSAAGSSAPAEAAPARPSSHAATSAHRTETTRRSAADQTSHRARTSPMTHRSDRVERVDRVPAAEPIDIPADDARRRATHEGTSAPMLGAEPNHDRLTIPAGTELQLVLENGLSSATSQEGDPVTARVERATGPDGRVLLPGGTVLKGRVYRAAPAGRVSGKSRLAVDFDRIVVRGAEHRLDTTAIDVEGPDSHGRDAAIVGGSTVGGAIIGGLLGGGNGAKKGAVVGVLGGTGAVLATRGKDVEIPSGSRWTVRVKDRVAVN
jgi:type IV secretory pathway VirB10-like protein